MKRLLLLFFFLIPLNSQPEDITKEFFTHARIPNQAFRVYREKFATEDDSGERITVNKAEERIAMIAFTVRPTQGKTYHYIGQLAVKPEFQKNGLGSDLLAYTVALCTGDCIETRLTAYPPSSKREDYQRLKRFYTKNGGLLAPGSEILGLTGKFTFQPKNEQ
ncbi:MAG: GNAT family N-acetyltransferase [Candidatus Babeliaceae bacterium]|nr:GNAT family N-acetyltransferase [Candidatus Babeliaceae bacterium]